MRYLAEKAVVEAAPEWVREFLAVGWGPPDKQGQRATLKSSAARIEPVLRRFSDEMTRALRDPAIATHQHSFALRDRDESGFAQFVLWSDPSFALAADVAQLWNAGAPLAECVVCGNLMSPEKGRVARTCSPACRLALHRQHKGA